MQTISVVNGDEIKAVVGYYNFTENNCFLSIVGEGRWLMKGFIPVFFRYPFTQLNKRRITTLTNQANPRALEFNRRLGFVEEGRMRKAVGDIDVILFGMLKEECRYLR
jgi:RimJ/RimL family protein N-acetyltransferase